jgi:hypothetical protein
MRRRLMRLWPVIGRPACDQESRSGEASPEPRTTRQPRLGRSGSTELAEVLALPGASPYRRTPKPACNRYVILVRTSIRLEAPLAQECGELL